MSKNSRVFAKLSKDYNKGIEYALENTAWDLFHSRMTFEHTRFYDTVENIVILPYFATPPFLYIVISH